MEGSATQVPAYIRMLRSEDSRMRADAREWLGSRMVHQDTIGEASAYATPFLLELLADEHCPDRAALLDLIITNSRPMDAPWPPGPVPVAYLRSQAEGGAALMAAKPTAAPGAYFAYLIALQVEDADRLQSFVELSAYDALRAGLPLVRTLLRSEDPALRERAAYALAHFPEEADLSLPPLSACLRPDSTGQELSTVIAAIGMLGGEIGRHWLLVDKPEVRFASAAALVHALGADAPDAAVRELLRLTACDQSSVREHRVFGTRIGLYACDVLRRWRPDLEDELFAAAMRGLAATPYPDCMGVLGNLAEIARTDRPSPPTPMGWAGYTARQQDLIKTLAELPGAWPPAPARFHSSTLRRWGLPADRDAMRALVPATLGVETLRTGLDTPAG